MAPNWLSTIGQWFNVRPSGGTPVTPTSWGLQPYWAWDSGYLPGTQRWTGDSWSEVMEYSPSHLWRTQPYLRTVVDFLARNVAQLSLQVFARDADNDRSRVRTGPMADIVARPNARQTSYDLILALISDLALYDNAYWMPTTDDQGRWQIQPLPADWVTPHTDDPLAVQVFYVRKPNGETMEVPAEQVIHFHGWDPCGPITGASPVQTLKLILAEQMEAQSYRQQVWRRGGRVGAVLERPVDAPAWNEQASQQFRSDWMSTWTGRDGPKAGGTPILEDGMTLKRIGFSAHEDEYIEAAKLGLQTVASVYHVNPVMVGLLDNANYSNVREFRRMLYGDTLGPILATVEARINTFLLPFIGENPDTYVEFNIAEKLQGSFEEQAQVMSTMVGRPIMTANEGRGRFNLPAIDDPEQHADELITPLNVSVGGQASPQNPTETPATPTPTENPSAANVEQLFRHPA